MKTLLILLSLLLSGCSSTKCFTYGKVGAGYKFDEAVIYYNGETLHDPISARLEIGKQCERWSYGVSHHSQWFNGKPFNNNNEYHKSEIFIDYTFILDTDK